MARIGFIGLGAMGLPMAKRLCEAGHSLKVTVHSNPEPVKELERLGAHAAPTLADALSGVDTVISIVPDDSQLKALFLSPQMAELIAPGTLLIEMTTASPSVMRSIGNHLAVRGVDVLDAPVSGGIKGAKEGTLTIICGGDASVHQKAMPLLEVMGAKMPLVGGVGAGKALKVINQLLVGVNTVMVAEALALAREMGIDLDLMHEVVSSSSGNSAAFGNKFISMSKGDFSPRFATPLMRKDMRIALAEGSNIDLPLATLANRMYEMLGPAADGFDYSIIAELYTAKK